MEITKLDIVLFVLASALFFYLLDDYLFFSGRMF